MPTRDELYAEIGERYQRQHRDDARDRRRFTLRVVLLCILWTGIGLYLGAWAFHTRDRELGGVFLLAGQLVIWIGVGGTIAWAMHRRRDRGWD